VKRRDVLLSLVGVASGAAAAPTPPIQTVLSPAAVEELMRAHGLDPMPGEPAQVRALLLSTRLSSNPDPRIEPSLRLDPELD